MSIRFEKYNTGFLKIISELIGKFFYKKERPASVRGFYV